MASTFPEDVVLDILQYLWVLHSTAWDSEFRQESHRRFFANYSLISSVWTAPAQRFVFRSAHLAWGQHLPSFELALKTGPRSGFLRQCIRVLDITISHSKLNVPLKKLDRLLRLAPSLIELRLRIGPELNTLFMKEKQEKRLRDAFQSLKPTLRALQVNINAHRNLNRCLKDLQSMISFPDLDFFSVVSSGTTSNRYLAKEQFPESDWNIVDIEWTKAHWPLETNAPGLSLGRILSPVPSSETTEGPIILPRSLRLYDEYCSTYGSNISPLLKVLGPHLEEILFQPRVTRWDWAAVCNHVIAHCPQLDRAVTLHVESAEDGARPAKGTRLTPRTTMHILETEDWRVPEEEDSTSTSDNGGDEAPELAEWEVDTSKVQVNTSDKMITRASHVVAFQEEPNSSWKSKHLDSAIHRKEPAFDPRWLAEALTDIEETRDVEEFRKNYECSWADLIPRYNYYFVASRKPKEISV